MRSDEKRTCLGRTPIHPDENIHADADKAYALKPVKFGLVVHDGTQGVQCPTVFFQIALRSADSPDHASAES